MPLPGILADIKHVGSEEVRGAKVGAVRRWRNDA